MPAESLKAEDGHEGHISTGFTGGAVKAKCTDLTVSALHRAALPGSYVYSLHLTACVWILGTVSSTCLV